MATTEPGIIESAEPLGTADHDAPRRKRMRTGMRGGIVESLLALLTSAAVGQSANTLANLILAALLAPVEFGAISVATLVTTACIVARNAFVWQTLIHRADRVREAADQMVMLAAAIGAGFCVLAWVGAEGVARFFHAPGSAPVLRLIALAFLIDSLGTVPDTLFEKELRFRRKMWLEVAKPLTVAVVSVTLAAAGLGPISVGWGQLAGFTVWTVGLYWLSDYRPRPRWDPALLRELLSYGRYVLAGSLLVFLFTNLDNASLARILGGRALGYYAFAFLLAYFPAKVLTDGVVAAVVLPVFSKLQARRDDQAHAYLETLRYVGYYAVPLCIGTIVLGPPALQAVYGHKWAPAIVPMQILTIYGFCHSYFLVTRNLCNATGRASAFWRISFLQLALVLPLLVVAPSLFGIAGTSALFTTSKVIATLVAIAYATRVTGISLPAVARALALPLAAGLGAGVVASLMLRARPAVGRHSHSVSHNFFAIAQPALLFLVLYLVSCLALDRALRTEVSAAARKLGLLDRLPAGAGAALQGIETRGRALIARPRSISLGRPGRSEGWQSGAPLLALYVVRSVLADRALLREVAALIRARDEKRRLGRPTPDDPPALPQPSVGAPHAAPGPLEHTLVVVPVRTRRSESLPGASPA